MLSALGHPRPPVCVTLHAEKLHTDAVWRQVVRSLDAVERGGHRCTLFVEPVRARILGVDLTARLAEVAGRGHEIGMHTHFYELTGPNGSTTGFVKKSLLTTQNIRRCLEEDLDCLLAAGQRPVGFVAGAWMFRESVFEWLGEHDFRYDCTSRAFRLRHENPDARAGDDHDSASWIGSVLEIPTTTPLSTVPRRLAPFAPRLAIAPVDYIMVYLHDYDLLDTRKRAVFALTARMLRGRDTTTACELAARVKDSVSP